MQKRLYRSTTNKVIAGVCGGIAEYLNVDPVVIRIVFLALLIFGVFPIILLYLIMWLIVPESSTLLR